MEKRIIKIPLDKNHRVTLEVPTYYSVFCFEGMNMVEHKTQIVEDANKKDHENWSTTKSKASFVGLRMSIMKAKQDYLTRIETDKKNIASKEDLDRWNEAWFREMWVQLSMEDHDMAEDVKNDPSIMRGDE